MNWLEKMNDDVKHILDAFALTVLSILGLDKLATGVDIVPLTATWRTIAMDWILFASAVCTFIWLFFRAVDVIVERIEKFQKWRRK